MDFEINAAGEVFPVVQFGNKIDVVFPELIMCADVYCAGVVFGHQVQPVQSFHRQVVFRQKVEFEIHTCGRLSVMREPAGTVIHVCGVNAQCSYPGKTEMLGCRQIISCKMIVLHTVLIELDGPTTVCFMRGGIVQTQDYLWSPGLPPAFFPQPQASIEGAVLIGVLSPRLFREISGAMLRIIDGAGVSHFEPGEDGYVQIIIECVFYLITTDILQRNKMQHIPSRHKCLVSLHLGSGSMKKSRCTV